MGFMRTWILGVTVVAMVLAVLEAMTPDGQVKKISRLTGGLLLMLTMIQPILQLDYADLCLSAHATVDGIPDQREEELCKSIIEEELRAYVLDKAECLGLSCRVELHCLWDETGGVSVERAHLWGDFDAETRRALGNMLTEDLGIPPAQQQFDTEEGTP